VVDKLTLDSCCRPILVVRAAGANQEVATPRLSMTDLIQVGPELAQRSVASKN
jgi:hypothetical protein